MGCDVATKTAGNSIFPAACEIFILKSGATFGINFPRKLNLDHRRNPVGHFRNAQGEEAGAITNSGDSATPGTSDRFPNALKCPTCGQAGQIIWEENAIGHREAGSQRRLIDVTPGFHAEAGRTQSGDPVIVCTGCDTIQAD